MHALWRVCETWLWRLCIMGFGGHNQRLASNQPTNWEESRRERRVCMRSDWLTRITWSINRCFTQATGRVLMFQDKYMNVQRHTQNYILGSWGSLGRRLAREPKIIFIIQHDLNGMAWRGRVEWGSPNPAGTHGLYHMLYDAIIAGLLSHLIKRSHGTILYFVVG